MPVVINGSTGISGIDGSAGTPAFQGSDNNTGIRFGADIVSLVTGGSDRLYIDSSGRVGVGTSSPGDRLHVVGPAAGISARFSDGVNATVAISHPSSGTSKISDYGGNYGFEFASSSLNFLTAGSERMRIDSSGRVGIGTASPGTFGAFAVRGYVTLGGSYGNVSGHFSDGITGSLFIKHAAGEIGYFTDSNVALTFYNNSTERIRIDSSGNLCIGATAFVNAPKLGVKGNTNLASSQAVIPSSSCGLVISSTSGGSVDNGGALWFDHGDLFSGIAGSRVSIGNWGTDLRFYTHPDSTTNQFTLPERMRIDSSGRLLVGTNSVYADSSELFEVYKANGPNNGWVSTPNLANDDSVSWRAVGGVSGVTLRQSGIGVYKHSGIATPCGFLYMQAQNADTLYYWTDNSSNFRISTLASNIGTTGGTVVGTQTSDERIKNILGPVEYGLNEIKQIEPVRYSLKAEPDVEKLGFIAQQVQPLIPQSIFDTNEHIEGEPEDAPTKLGMEYVSLIPVLVNAIKELSAEVDALKTQLQAQ